MSKLEISDLVDSILCVSDDCPDDLRDAHLKTSILEMVDSAAMRNVCKRLGYDWGDHVYFDGGNLIGESHCGREDAEALRDEWAALWDALPKNAKEIAQ